ncbi:hypothetical protein AKJ44_00915 [candidate division MSBL1 archaeon SCGC-AAA261F17]|uniref:Regulatory protein Cgi121 n=1 Tax=candidate division MSBL1 archaeon SCGC-AAA261F17 TaxID=1698274 RepID=A0A133V752_9EURY|nr:hypothetical protein AKJ44_00915 [candidate division MSBL1 archaeon SCGC-AAA261F17]
MLELNGPFGRRVLAITGAHAHVEDVESVIRKVRKISRANEVVSQIFNAKHIAGRQHLIHAARLALIAQEEGRNFADSQSIELTCWTAGLRQINQALERVGLRKGSAEVAILTIGGKVEKVKKAREEILHELGAKQGEGVLDLTPEKEPTLIRDFGISESELEVANLQSLVLERVALLSLER